MPLQSLEYKSIFASKTFWGAVVMLLSFFFPKLIPGDNPQDVVAHESLISQVGTFVGFLLAVYGRMRATKPVTLTGKPSSALLLLLTLALVLPVTNGCAVFHKQAPQLPPAVANELNLADQLRQLERDYRTFFSDVGDAQRSGQLTAAEVGKLNAMGDKLKPVIERGNKAFQEWQANRADDSKKALVMAAIQEGTGLFLDLTSQRSKMARAHSGGSQ